MTVETVTIPAGTIALVTSLVAGVWRPGGWVPAGRYEIHKKPNGVDYYLRPPNDGPLGDGTFYYPLYWRQVWSLTRGNDR